MKKVAFIPALRQPAAWLLFGCLLGAYPARPQTSPAIAENCYVAGEPSLGEERPAPPPSAPAPVPLAVGQPIKSTVTSDETQTYVFRLAAGQVAHAAVEQQGVDVVVTALTPSGQSLAEIDNPNGSKGLEMLWLQAAAAGDYRLAVRPLEKNSAGAYQVTLEAVRTATPADAQRLRAQQLMAEGQTLRGALSLRSSSAAERQAAVDKFAAAYAIWQELKEPREADLAMLSLGITSASAALVAAKLPSSTNKMTVFYSPGFEARALAMRTNLEAALAFFTAKLHVSLIINLAILNQTDWPLPNRQFQVPYGTPYSVPGLVVMLATLDFDKQVVAVLRSGLSAPQLRAVEAGGRTIEQQVQIYFEDIAYHEMGHLYEYAYGVKAPTHWVNEFLASYLMLAYLDEKQPARAKNMQRMSEAFVQAAHPEHTSLDDFERFYLGVSPMNYGWYQGQFALRVATVYPTEKLGFLDKMKTAFPFGSGPRLTSAEVLQRVDQLSPGFAAWEQQLTPAAAATTTK